MRLAQEAEKLHFPSQRRRSAARFTDRMDKDRFRPLSFCTGVVAGLRMKLKMRRGLRRSDMSLYMWIASARAAYVVLAASPKR
jgi:hypothetical protein